MVYSKETKLRFSGLFECSVVQLLLTCGLFYKNVTTRGPLTQQNDVQAIDSHNLKLKKGR